MKYARYYMLAFVALLGFIGWVFFGGEPHDRPYDRFWGNPHMINQAKLRTYNAELPGPLPGAVPVDKREMFPPMVKSTPAAIHRGATYYTYYCLMCHGENGDGHGPVGESYLPKPADISSAKVRAYSGARLMHAMIEGVGHAPVLGYTVQPEHRPYLVLFLREMQRKAVGDRQ